MQQYSRIKKAAVIWLSRRLPPCEDVTPLISLAMDRPLTLRERVTVRVHLHFCTWCRRYEQQLHLIHDVLHVHDEHLAGSEHDTAEGLSAEARARIEQSLSGSQSPS